MCTTLMAGRNTGVGCAIRPRVLHSCNPSNLELFHSPAQSRTAAVNTLFTYSGLPSKRNPKLGFRINRGSGGGRSRQFVRNPNVGHRFFEQHPLGHRSYSISSSVASPLPHSHQCTLNCRQIETQPIFCGYFFFAKIEILRRFVANSAAILALWFLLPLATPYHNY